MSVGQFIVNPDDLRTLVSGLAGVVGDLDEIGGVIRTGDAGSAGDSRLVESIANFQSIWSTGVTGLHESLVDLSDRLKSSADAYSAADADIGSGFGS